MTPYNLARPKSRFPILESPGRGSSYWLRMSSYSASDATLALEAGRRKYVVKNAWDEASVTKMKAADPSCMIFCYKDLSSTRSDPALSSGGVDLVDLPAGVGYIDANTNHSDWFLVDSGGNRIIYTGYAGHYQMDVSKAAYRQKWADNVITNLKLHGFDGVFADNALFRANQYGTVGTAYTTDAATQTAYVGFLQAIYPQFQAAGLKIIGNLANSRINGNVWNTYTQYLDGGFDEWWLTFGSTYPGDYINSRNSDGTFYTEGWLKQVAEIVDSEAAGKIALVQPHYTAGDTNAFRFTYASFLMGAGGRAAFSEVGSLDAYTDPKPYHTEYDWDLGFPSGAYTSPQAGVYRRDFSAGCVVVNGNAGGTGNVTVALGATYLDEAGTSVTSVTLAPLRGTILRKP